MQKNKPHSLDLDYFVKQGRIGGLTNRKLSKEERSNNAKKGWKVRRKNARKRAKVAVDKSI